MGDGNRKTVDDLHYNSSLRTYRSRGKGVGKRLGRILINRLEQAYQSSLVENAHFSSDPDENERIKQKVRIYLQTWVTTPVDDVIAVLREAVDEPRR